MKSEMNRVKRSINKIRRNKNTQKFRLHVLLPLTEQFVKTTEQIYTKPGWRTSLGSEQTSLTFGADPHEGICACWVLVNVAVEVCFFESDLFSVWSRLIRLKGAIGSCWVLLGLVGSSCSWVLYEDHQNLDPTSHQSDSLWLLFIIPNVRSFLSPAHTSFR